MWIGSALLYGLLALYFPMDLFGKTNPDNKHTYSTELLHYGMPGSLYLTGFIGLSFLLSIATFKANLILTVSTVFIEMILFSLQEALH